MFRGMSDFQLNVIVEWLTPRHCCCCRTHNSCPVICALIRSWINIPTIYNWCIWVCACVWFIYMPHQSVRLALCQACFISALTCLLCSCHPSVSPQFRHHISDDSSSQTLHAVPVAVLKRRRSLDLSGSVPLSCRGGNGNGRAAVVAAAGVTFASSSWETGR